MEKPSQVVLELPGGEVWAVEIKRSTAPKVSKGFWIATDDVKATRKFVVYPGDETYSAGNGVQVVSLKSLLEMLTSL